jgi:arsenite methyltransferase
VTRDLLHRDEVKALVRDAYAAVDGGTRAVAERLYSPEELALLPESAIDRALGVANHLRQARIEPDDVVLDLGCGGGIDTLLAARRAALVIGLDFLPAMLERTRAAAAEAGLENVVVLEGEIEAIPLPDATVDHVISNGVVNLSARKSRVLAECARVLRPGGRLTVADLTVEDQELPPEILTHPATWAG